METAHIWIASDRWQRNAGAEEVLDYSIRKHASCPVEIHWMRAGDPGFEVTPDGKNGSWRIGRTAGQAWPKKGWGTDFSCFRMAIPELAKWKGRHIYMDSDMLVLGDVAELLALPSKKPFLCLNSARTDVSVIDASGCEEMYWPLLKEMKASGWRMFEWVKFLHKHDLVDMTLPPNWNVCDPYRRCADPGVMKGMKLLHFTTVPTQPWRPYKTVNYQVHPWQSWVRKWQRYQTEAKASV